jgi:hypothetical protein
LLDSFKIIVKVLNITTLLIAEEDFNVFPFARPVRKSFTNYKKLTRFIYIFINKSREAE